MPTPDTAQNLPRVPPRTVRTAGGAVLLAASAGVMALLSQWEPDKRDPGLVYADQLAGGLPTVCKGITRHVTSTPIIVGERWSEAKCAQEEAQAVVQVQQQLARCFARPDVPQAVFDAASSHAWNNGAGATCSSQAMRAFNAGDWSLGCRRLGLSDAGRPVWSFVSNKDGSMRYVQGLANRRASETAYCRRGLQP